MHVTINIFIFVIGFLFFEYGSSRPKSSSKSLIKHPFLLAISTLNSFFVSFGIAYGSPRLIGSKYFLNINVFSHFDNLNDESVGLNFIIFSMTCYMVSALATSGMNEQATLATQLLFGFLVTVCFLPLATAWTVAGGFLYQLRLFDEAALFSLHLVAGGSALIGSILIEPRVSKYFQTSISRIINVNYLDEKQEFQENNQGQNIKLLYKAQRKLDKISRNFDITFKGQQQQNQHSISQYKRGSKQKQQYFDTAQDKIQKFEQIINSFEKDSFHQRKSNIYMYVGTLIMWISLAHFSSGIQQPQSIKIIEVNQTYINSIVAGSAGALGAFFTYFLLRFFKLKKENKKIQKNNFLVDQEEIQEQRQKSYLIKMQYFINLDSQVEIYFILRGIIAGIVSILIRPSSYLTWTAFISGFIAGAVFMFSIRIFHVSEIDDNVNVTSAHFIVSIFSIVSIFLFDKNYGLFFQGYLPSADSSQSNQTSAQNNTVNETIQNNDFLIIYLNQSRQNQSINNITNITYQYPQNQAKNLLNENLIVTFGSNVFGLIVIVLTIFIVTGLARVLFMQICFRRSSKQQEVYGFDCIKNIELLNDNRNNVTNFINQVLNEYHPQNIQSYLHIKRKQLKQIAKYTKKKDGNKFKIWKKNENEQEIEGSQFQEPQKQLSKLQFAREQLGDDLEILEKLMQYIQKEMEYAKVNNIVNNKDSESENEEKDENKKEVKFQNIEVELSENGQNKSNIEDQDNQIELMNPESERQDQILNDDEVGPGNYDSRTYLNAEKPGQNKNIIFKSQSDQNDIVLYSGSSSDEDIVIHSDRK